MVARVRPGLSVFKTSPSGGGGVRARNEAERMELAARVVCQVGDRMDAKRDLVHRTPYGLLEGRKER